MRKWFWCCTAAGVAAAGFLGTVRYCCTHPDSAVTKGLASVCTMGLNATPWGGLAGAPLGAEGLRRSGASAKHGSCADGHAVTSKPVLQLELPGTSPVSPIVIREDEDLNEPAVILNPDDEMCGLIGMADEWQARPGETRPPHRVMPYADEEVAAPHAACEPISVWERLAALCNCDDGARAAAAGAGLKVECPAGEGHDGPSLWRRFVQALTGEAASGGSEEAEPKQQTEPVKDENYLNSHYHDHDLTCPYSGRSYPGTPNAPRPVPVSDPKAGPMKGGSEESETVKPMKAGTSVNPMHFFNDPQELLQWRPAFPRIDTMEFRPSDHRLSEYGRMPGTL